MGVSIIGAFVTTGIGVTVSVGRIGVGGRAVKVGEGAWVGGKVIVGDGLGASVGVLAAAWGKMLHPDIDTINSKESAKTFGKVLLMFIILISFTVLLLSGLYRSDDNNLCWRHNAAQQVKAQPERFLTAKQRFVLGILFGCPEHCLTSKRA